MGWFSKRSPEASRPVEATAEAPKAGVKREKPDFSALAMQRNEKFAQKTGGLWERMKSGMKSVKDFVLTLDARTAYRAGQAKDATVEGAQYVGQKGREGVKAGVEAGAQAGAWAKEGATDIAVAGMEAGKQVGNWAKEGGQDVYRTGTAGVEIAMNGIKAGAEATRNKFNETRTSLGEKFRDMRKVIMDSAEMKHYNKEAQRQKRAMEKIKALQDQIAMSKDTQAVMQEGFKKRCAERGVDYGSLFEQQQERVAA